MTLSTIKKYVEKIGMETKEAKLIGDKLGIFVSMYITEYTLAGRAIATHHINRDVEDKFFKYLARYQINYEWRGNFISVLITEDDIAA